MHIGQNVRLCLWCVHEYPKNTDEVWLAEEKRKSYFFRNFVNPFKVVLMCDIDNVSCEKKDWGCDDFIEERSNG